MFSPLASSSATCSCGSTIGSFISDFFRLPLQAVPKEAAGLPYRTLLQALLASAKLLLNRATTAGSDSRR